MTEISSIQRARPLNDNLWIREELPTKANLYIAHNCIGVTFISIEFREVLEEKDVEIDINPIQAPNTVCTGYLLGLVPSMVDKHWCNILNKHPKLASIDIDIKHDFVKTSP